MDEQRAEQLARIGCIVCRLYRGVHSPAHIHHLQGLKYRAMGKKASDMHSIGLCPSHHQYGTKDEPSVHSHPAEFERRFGTQEELLEATNKMIEAARW